MGKILIFITLIITFSFGIVACDKTVVMNTKRHETEIKETEEETNDSQDPFENFYSFNFKVEEDKFYLPMTYGEIINLGWSCGLKGDESLLGSLGLSNLIFTKGEHEFSGTLTGTSEYYVEAKDMVLTAITFSQDKSQNARFELPKNVIINKDDKNSIIEKIGESEEKLVLEEENNNMMYLYPYDIDENIMIIFDNKTEKATKVSLTKYVKTLGFEKKQNSILNYVFVKELSENLNDQIFQIDDTLYKMPVPTNQFMENGYSVKEAGLSIPSGKMLNSGDTTSFNLVKDELSINVIIENFDAEPKSFSECYITRLTLSNVESHNIKVNSNIDFTITAETLEKKHKNL